MFEQYSNFLYGNTSDVLNANRQSDIYRYSARKIVNGYVTERGTLRIQKKFEEKVNVGEEIYDIQSLKNNNLIVVSENNLTIYKNFVEVTKLALTTPIDDTYNITLTRRRGASKDINDNPVVDYELLSIVKEGSNFFYKIVGDVITKFDFFTDTNKPLDNKKIVYADIYRVYSYSEITLGKDNGAADTNAPATTKTGNMLMLQKLGNDLVNPVVTIKNNKVKLDEIAGDVKRIYFSDTNDFISTGDRFSTLTTSAPDHLRDVYVRQINEASNGHPSLDDLKQGDIIMNFHSSNKQDLLFGFGKAIPSGHVDPSADSAVHSKLPNLKDYYTEIQAADGRARLLSGDVVELNNKVTSVSEFQGRLAVSTSDTIYFSRQNDTQDFTNGSQADDPFFLKVTPISNRTPKILQMYSSRGLFVLTTGGILSVNYNQVLTPASTSLVEVSDTPATKHAIMINYTLYFISTDGFIYAVQEDKDTTGARLYSYSVEKYRVTQKVSSLTSFRYDRRQRLITMEEDLGSNLYLYDSIGSDEFRNTEFEMARTAKDNVIKGLNEVFCIGGKIYVIGEENYEKMSLQLHPPYSETDMGSFFSDQNTYVQRVSARMLNQDNKQIKTMKVVGQEGMTETRNLSPTVGRTSIYYVDCHLTVQDGVNIEIHSEPKSNGLLEISGIEVAYKLSDFFG